MFGSCSLNDESSCNDFAVIPDSVKTDKFTVVVEGNIGSGKSTFLQHFSSSPHVEIFQEPVAMWKSVRGNNTLELMYKDAKRWSLAFQSYVQLTMTEIHCKVTERPVKLMERSIYSARACFVENLHRADLMPDFDFAVLNEWYDWIVKKKANKIDLIVYLRVDPEICRQRLIKRNRAEESEIPLSYLNCLHELHEDWLMKGNQFPIPAPVLVLDCNKDISLLRDEFNSHKTEILCGFV